MLSAANTIYVGGDFGVLASLYRRYVPPRTSSTGPFTAGTQQTLSARLSSLERVEAVWAGDYAAGLCSPDHERESGGPGGDPADDQAEQPVGGQPVYW